MKANATARLEVVVAFRTEPLRLGTEHCSAASSKCGEPRRKCVDRWL